ncbi:tetratricopeptide repeat protein 22-like [Acanthaster planci]|uniref:Tetratricopeptide repeat protein 22-like n=1 Tax=Acanthaster planci TaxID=133434 RepID=A0A8B8A0Y9_ACAPL|nr:tetratricopeptide repeat protein 22-like [Acanthaster planci]
MAGDVPPVGHFGLPLHTNTGTIVPVTANYKRGVLEYYLNRKGDRPERHALRNLLGVLAFQQGQRDLARQHFDRILSEGEDPGNLNARANLDHVNTVVTSDNDLPDLETEDGKRRQARRYAEQGFAFMFELYDETVTHQRYRQARDLYVKAMELAGNLVDHKEKEDWHFGIGLANFKMFSIPATMSAEAMKAALDSAVKNFRAILTSAQADNAMKCDAWFELALTVNKALKSHILRPTITLENLTPQACLDNALQVSPDNFMEARIQARKAYFCYQADPRNGFQEAIHLLERSIELDSSKINFHAYSTRANIYLEEYESSNNVDLLHSAQADLEHILKEHVSPWDFEMLAKVYLYLAKSTTQEEESKAYIQKALQNCTNSEKCQDGANRPSLQTLREQILRYSDRH